MEGTLVFVCNLYRSFKVWWFGGFFFVVVAITLARRAGSTF